MKRELVIFFGAGIWFGCMPSLAQTCPPRAGAIADWCKARHYEMPIVPSQGQIPALPAPGAYSPLPQGGAMPANPLPSAYMSSPLPQMPAMPVMPYNPEDAGMLPPPNRCIVDVTGTYCPVDNPLGLGVGTGCHCGDTNGILQY